ncbi:helicase/secretion neighborhood TadE-like protein [Mycolicibacterium chubuense NBB4]|uniref:Helicase/secretion neighborhood TadE-like protein n=1 Tax=Mycolicibacterium chubuense (strain NBB4) TaxID=710421 RepID=I4BQ98_MYCCN|nr:Rv3654c family TadE-like protein [Mycolicibacterium chubuense]AFM19455.1 helicase/secretion neighborhood TadE-like protein [Mycolicibacterium chubuense NBB4]
MGDERGSATVLAVMMVLVLVAVTTGAAMVGSAVVARHRAQAAADLAAVRAAAQVSSGPAVACATAKTVAEAMGAALTGCTVEELDVVVRVGVAAQLRGIGSADAVARAGPAHRE